MIFYTYLPIFPKVTIVEYLDHIGGMGIDMEISKLFGKILAKQGLNFKLSTKVISAELNGNCISVAVEGVKDGKTDTVCFANGFILFLFKTWATLYMF